MTLSAARGFRCRWCGRRFAQSEGAGRPRQYCKRSCRQRDYEARRRANELGLGEHELIVTRHELDELRDRLYILGDTVAEIERDLADDAEDGDTERRLLAVLLEAAKHAGSQLRATPRP
ncbi:MAG TPA: hypothetical protein VK771_07870 [Acidimicrobiia bacterium]|nr:hypothetical protein [Acidimicrobiia bacterium]